MNELTIHGGNAVTMTSLELVDYINSQREKGEAVLAHSDFLKKVPQVLGETVAGNFSGYYKASNGKRNPLYTFPKRESCLMAMSYSYEAQAKVFDHMTSLEQKLIGLPATLVEDISNSVMVKMGGMVKGIVHKQIVTAMSESLPSLVHSVLASQQTTMRQGRTAGQVWKSFGLQTKQMRGYASWLVNRLVHKPVAGAGFT